MSAESDSEVLDAETPEGWPSGYEVAAASCRPLQVAAKSLVEEQEQERRRSRSLVQSGYRRYDCNMFLLTSTNVRRFTHETGKQRDTRTFP